MDENSDEIDGWIIKNKRINYSFFYIIFFILDILAIAPLPDPPDITYTLENKNSGTVRTVTLSGAHKREELAAAIARLQSELQQNYELR